MQRNKLSVEDGKSYMVTKALIATTGVTAIKETNLKPYEFATSTESDRAVWDEKSMQNCVSHLKSPALSGGLAWRKGHIKVCHTAHCEAFEKIMSLK